MHGTYVKLCAHVRECRQFDNYMLLNHCNRPLINGKLEDKSCGDGPSLDSIFEDDVHLQQLIEGILVCLFRP